MKEEEARRLQEELEDARRKMEENQRALSEVLAPPVVHVAENDVEESHEENMEGGEWREGHWRHQPTTCLYLFI